LFLKKSKKTARKAPPEEMNGVSYLALRIRTRYLTFSIIIIVQVRLKTSKSSAMKRLENFLTKHTGMYFLEAL